MNEYQLPQSYVGVCVSESTLKPHDLIKSFWNLLSAPPYRDQAKPFGAIKQSITNDVSAYTSWNWDLTNEEHFAELTEDVLMDDGEDDLRDYILELLFEAIDEIAPNGCSFAGHGSDFGFWVHQ